MHRRRTHGWHSMGERRTHGRHSMWRWLLILAAISALGRRSRSRRARGFGRTGHGWNRGVGGAGRWSWAAHAGRSRPLPGLIVANEIADEVTDETLAEVWSAVLEQAKAGNAEAAGSVFEVARRQRFRHRSAE